MPRPPAKFTETDLKRALKAAQDVDRELLVRIRPDGTIEVYRAGQDNPREIAPPRAWVT
ncbi:MAG: hypothetical protein ABFD96_05890 [Armatimonadia bacterium]